MNISTFMTASAFKRVALVAVLAMGGFAASAQTFVYQGVIYKASGNKLTAQKPTASVTVGDPLPDAVYKGDITIPHEVAYDGKTYYVTSIGSVFKGMEGLTSIDIAKGVTTISRGCFQGCTSLVSAKLPEDLATLNGDVFSGCTALREIVIPGTVKEVASNQFKGCTSLSKITLAEGETPIEFSVGAFPDNGLAAVKEAVINRAIGSKYTDMGTKPFRGAPALETVTIGGTCTELPASYFEGTATLKNVIFANSAEKPFTTLNTNVFAGTGIETVTLPESVTILPASLFQGCKSLNEVVLGSGVTTISDMAFYNSTLAKIAFPAGVTRIGQMAFSGTKLSGAIVLPEALKSAGLQAFANNQGITEISVPAATTSIGDGAFLGCPSIAKFAVDAANTAYKADADGKAIATADGAYLLAYAPAAEGTSFAGDYTALAPYAFYKASKLDDISLPKCVTFGDYSMSQTAIKSLTIGGQVGRYVAAGCPALAELNINSSEIPFGIAANNAALTTVNINNPITIVKQDAFLNCTGLTSLDLGNILSIIEADAFKGSGIKNLTVGAKYPAAMAQGVFNPGDDITVKVPVDLVEAYKNAGGWSNLNIVGDANITIGGEDMGMPNGLYYAGVDGDLHAVYTEGEPTTYSVGGVPHTFQLTQFKNRIYGASAGQKFVYSSTGSVDGDGKLFYISQVGGNTFQAVVLDNQGNNAYKDPFGLYIYGDTLYVNDRNVCIRKIAADAIALPQDYASWMENNWMGFYGAQWSYGCIKSGFAITQDTNEKGDPEPLYWVGMKYNGNGIYRFKEQHIGTSGSPKPAPENLPVYLNACGPIFTTFYVDEANNQLYIYIEKAGAKEEALLKGGLYRININDLNANPDPSDPTKLPWQLIDGSPVKYEGSATNEHVGITQLSPDENGEYLYWCYRAPSAEEAAANEAQDFAEQGKGKYWWADKYDAANPLQQSGIKRIKLGEAQPVVEMVAPGVEGYGVVPVNYEGSKSPSGAISVIAPAQQEGVITVAADVITAAEAADVTVYNMAGVMVNFASLAAGETLSIADLDRGAYIVSAKSAAAEQVVKVVK